MCLQNTKVSSTVIMQAMLVMKQGSHVTPCIVAQGALTLPFDIRSTTMSLQVHGKQSTSYTDVNCTET